MSTSSYPSGAFRSPGVLWWSPPAAGRRPGAEARLAAWLFFNRPEGSTFTLAEAREALGGPLGPNDDEHMNRRLRQLRQDGWVIASHLHDASLSIGEYRVDVAGWWPGSGRRPSRQKAIPASIRREVLARDGYRCALCGVAAGEPQRGLPSSPPAVITVGHRVPLSRGGSSREPTNLRAECSLCNEAKRNVGRDPETLAELLPEIEGLAKREAELLLSWMAAGHRLRSALDQLYDRVRMLPELERAQIEARLARRVQAPVMRDARGAADPHGLA